MTVDLFNAGLLPHQGALFYVQHAVFYARYAVGCSAVSCSWRRAVCSMFSPPLLALRCTQMQGRLEQASRSQLGTVAKVQVFVSFNRRYYTSN